MGRVVTLKEQLDTVQQAVLPLIDRTSDDPQGAYGQVKSAIAECEALITMLNQEKSDIEWELIEQSDVPDPYYDI